MTEDLRPTDPECSLDTIGVRLQSIRSSLVHDYLRSFETHLPVASGRPLRILDLTLDEIAGARSFAEFIDEGVVVVSIHPDYHIKDDHNLGHPRLILKRGDPRDPAYLCGLHEHGPFDLVIENGRHIVEDQLLALEYLIPALVPGGVMIIESAFASRPESEALIQGGVTDIVDVLKNIGAGLARRTLDIKVFDGEIVAKCLASVTFEKSNAILRRIAEPGYGPPVVHARPFAEIGESIREVLPSEPYRRTDPDVQSELAWIIERLSGWIGKPAHPPAGIVGTIPHAIVFGEGTVVDQAGNLVVDSLMNQREVRRLPFFKKLSGARYAMADFAVVEHLPGDKIVALKQRWDTNYGHWLVETLPRAGIVGEVFPITECKFLVTAWSEAMANVMRQSLLLAGAREENILRVSGNPVSVDNLLYVPPISEHSFLFHPYAARFLRGLAVKHLASQPRKHRSSKVYVSRNKGTSRCITNEEEVVAVLTSRGYETVYPECHSFLEQVEIFGECTHVVGNLGAAMTNVAFARDGVGMLALTTELMPDDFFWDLTSHRGGRYFSLHGKAASSQALPAQSGMNAHFHVHIPQLIETLDRYEKACAQQRC